MKVFRLSGSVYGTFFSALSGEPEIGLEKPTEGLLFERSEFRHSGFARPCFSVRSGHSGGSFCFLFPAVGNFPISECRGQTCLHYTEREGKAFMKKEVGVAGADSPFAASHELLEWNLNLSEK